MAPKPITSPVPDAWYPTLSVVMLSIGLIVTASFFMYVIPIRMCFFLGGTFDIGDGNGDRVLALCYEATSSRRSRSLAKELITGAVASVFLVKLVI
ncbi:hypothetical protein FEM48_Zijuj08G0011000 [Ziziphus jujuba var. spinosa]|uniref:Dolichyl-diphosphooligosaccharide-protein glycosyltransferase subunit OST5 n=1 Tax=Ziziphus jujuba var. spinosa TaxID=714518 RepID=A0A978UW39_ZIZJJ|nr:hypothetical protein FEM48_Zijuj08G0011000 [Ziziphus jujuba var. spinosa]